MKITLKLYANLSGYLPANAQYNRVEIDIAQDNTPHQVLSAYHVPLAMAHLVLLNGVYLLPEQRDQPLLKSGDTLAVWPPVAGG
ncbi:MoaD/ThiS family protein [Thioflexithrix psekupsensis]|uniref:Molybdopterin synthase sulfur carrier subunit n=1 Tax=Thioflexithrix psekupsensis TaxID=1570016 RepID=A0A251X8M8_9GAMM|nr:MoaD/ThiS family protein [Thioflexithrix psekupsensis]OUD14290.1 molybdopterin synthase sulfur carrier subunit [Thioflexithrix psekupsensis]